MFFLLVAGRAEFQKDDTGYMELLMALPEEEIDIGLAALRLAKEIYPDLDVPAYSKKIDDLAWKVNLCQFLSAETETPVEKITAMNTVLYEQEGYFYDVEALCENESDQSHLAYLLDTKSGNCYSLTNLYLTVAQRLGYPVYPVALPSHYILRYVDPASKNIINIDPSSGGSSYPDGHYIGYLAVNETAIKKGGYLRTLTYREYLSVLFTETASILDGERKWGRAIDYLEKAIELNPVYPSAYAMMGMVYCRMGLISENNGPKLFDTGYQYSELAGELGLVYFDDTPLAKEMTPE